MGSNELSQKSNIPWFYQSTEDLMVEFHIGYATDKNLIRNFMISLVGRGL